MGKFFVAMLLFVLGCNQISGADDITFPDKNSTGSDSIPVASGDAGLRPDAGSLRDGGAEKNNTETDK